MVGSFSGDRLCGAVELLALDRYTTSVLRTAAQRAPHDSHLAEAGEQDTIVAIAAMLAGNDKMWDNAWRFA
jgi:hypothetical protein